MKTCLVLFAAALGLLHGSPESWAKAHGAIVISNDPTQNMSCSAGVCDPTDFHAVLNVNDLENLLAASDVTVNTRFFIKSRPKYLREIDLTVPLSWSAPSKLTLGGTYVNATVAIAAPVLVPGQAGLILPVPYWTLSNGITLTFGNTDSILSIGGQAYTLVADFPTLANDISANTKGFFALINDYDAVNDQFSNAPIATFSGTLLGLGHAISNLTIPKGRKLCEGMIASNSGGVSHLKLSNISVILDKKSRYVGGVAGCNYGNVYDVAVSGQIAGGSDSDAGGVAGINYTNINFAGSSATVTGGQAGGLAGENDSGVDHASSSGSVSGVIDSGGLVGNNSQYIDSSYTTASVSGSKNNTGGFAGSNRGQITNSYALGAVSGASGAAGGFVGYNVGSVQYAYSVGAVIGSKKYTGGFAGYDANETIDTAYWDIDTSGIKKLSDGAGFPKYDPGIIGLKNTKLQSGVPFGFDKRKWRQNPSINNGYPYLLANPPPEGTPKKSATVPPRGR